MTWSMAKQWVEVGLAVMVSLNDDQIVVRTRLGCVLTVYRNNAPRSPVEST